MEGLAMESLIKLAPNFGVPGIILVIWYFSEKSHERTLNQYRADMVEQRRMYESNVELVKSYLALVEDHQDLVIMNTRSNTRLSDMIEKNEFCPQVRLKKMASGVEG